MELIEEHYSQLGPNYNELLHYSPDFVRCLTKRMIEKLRLKEDDVLVDLGCGTCIYSMDLVRQVPLREPVIAVDPFEEMLRHIPDEMRATKVNEDAVSFSERPGGYNKVLIKEAIHHVKERERLFRNLYDRLPGGGIILLVHVPPRVDYPLFSKALDRCLTWHADPDELVSLLERAGFEVERDELEYEHAIPKERYIEMVRNCYMSVLSSFEPDELAAGIEEIEQRYADEDMVRFTDHFDYLTATKR